MYASNQCEVKWKETKNIVNHAETEVYAVNFRTFHFYRGKKTNRNIYIYASQ